MPMEWLEAEASFESGCQVPARNPGSSSGAQIGNSRARKYGVRFSTGFLDFYKQQELSDVIVVGPDGVEYKMHALLLAYHSEFFRRAMASEFREGAERRLVLGLEDTMGVWPTLVEYFYTEEVVLTDENVLALLAMSRELMVSKIQEYCADYAQSSLEASNAICFLKQAVHFSCDSFRQSCVMLVAEGFASSFYKPTDGLPVEVMLEVLQHPSLMVQTEDQVLTFVLNYVKQHNLEAGVVRQLFQQVRLPFLSNERLAQLSSEDCVPHDMLLSAMACRLQLIDHPEKLSAGGSWLPRKTYICSMEYGLPGGSEYVAIPMEAVWEDLASQLKVKVSGEVVEGDAESILRTHDDSAWFMVSGDPCQQAVWVEIEFPSNMRVVELTKYTFSHGMNVANHMFPYGISDLTWLQIKGLCTLVSTGGDADAFVPLRTQESCQMPLEYTVVVDGASPRLQLWRRMRITTSEEQMGNNVRLSIRRLKLYGRLEVSLTSPSSGKDLLAVWRRKKEARMLNHQAGGSGRSRHY